MRPRASGLRGSSRYAGTAARIAVAVLAAVLPLRGATGPGAASAPPFAVPLGAGGPYAPSAAAVLRPGPATPPAAPPHLILGLAGTPLTMPSSAPPEEVARGFVERVLAPAGEIVHLSTVVGGGGVRFVHLEQRFGGVPVALGRIGVAVGPDGAVLAARVGELAPAGPDPRSPGRRVTGADQALDAALEVLGSGGPRPAREDWSAEEVLLPTATGALPAWRVRVVPARRPDEGAEVLVAATDGRPLRRETLAMHAVQAARVFPGNPLRPTAWVEFPDPALRPSHASPVGWAYDLETTGNNVWAQLDREADFFPPYGATATATGVPPVFDFPFTGDPVADADAALANVFWALNDAHDRFHRLGFDEASGAMQEDSLGRGGVGGDRVWALVQYASGDGSAAYNDVTMGVGADGTFTWMAVGIFDLAGEPRDGAFETDLLYHEYTHGVSVRLVGDDAACRSGVQPAAVFEGWGDFFGASFTGDPIIGAWVSGDDVRGLREDPLDGSSYTLFNFCFDGCDAHRDSLIWSGALWEMRRRLIALLGPEEGVETAERIVVEAMRYTPCRPTFLEARDALLLADSALYAGDHRCLIGSVMAQWGMGWSAATTGPDDQAPTGAVDPSPECTGGASVRFDEEEYGVEADATVEVVDASPGAAPRIVVSAASGDSETFDLAPVPGGPLLRAAFPLAAGASAPGDGVLQVTDGDVLTADYPDGGASATAGVSGTLGLSVVTHRVYGDCRSDPDVDDDSVPGFYNLTGFLDAGEQADLVIVLGHTALSDLEDVTVAVTSANPDVVVLPTAPLALGRVPRSNGVAPRQFGVQLRAQAAPTVTAADTADLRIRVESRGRADETVLTLRLNRDYVLETGLSPFDGGVETFEPTSSTAGSWAHEACLPGDDRWSLETCAGEGGGSGFEDGSPGCGPYSYGQVAATLLSPPILPLPSDAVAFRLTDFGWSNDVDLWTDPANPYCDADMVAVFATVDPAALPCGDPLGVYNYGPQRVYLFVDNNDGYRPSGPFGVNTDPQLLDPAVPYDQLRLAWLFYGDIIDCFQTNANQGHYRLDNVRFRYDLVREVPDTTTCSVDCAMRVALSADPDGFKCDGEDFVLSAEGTEVVGCPGPVRYAFAGPGVPPAYGWTYEQRSPAVGQDGATYSIYAQCEANPDCDDYVAVQNFSPASPGVGGPVPGTLRVRRSGADLVLEWRGGSLPPAYGVYSTTDPALLPLPIASWGLAGTADGEGPDGEASLTQEGAIPSAGLTYFQVAARDPCTGEPRQR